MINRSVFILFMVGLAIQPASAEAKPNIVFILADDMSFDSVSANNEKMGPLKTPRIDRLIAEGMNFTDAHSGSAVCTPTRYGLLTGRYCWRTRMKSSVLWDWAAPLIEPERLTVAEMLQQAGYQTGMIGKWHLGLTWFDQDGNLANGDLKLSDASFRKGGPAQRVAAVAQRVDFARATKGGPNDHGFDYWFGVDVPNFPPYVWMENGKTLGIPSVPKPKHMFGCVGPMLPGWKLEDILAGLGERGASWIAEASQKDKPFFLYVPLTSPHLPTAPSARFQGKSGISPYADFVMETDWVVGQLVDALEKAGVADDTLVIFSTDNGTSPGGANFSVLEKHGVDLRHHFKGVKRQIHEGGHRVPFVARWPAKIKAGSTCRETIGLNDFMATAADILKIDLPDHAAEDSYSILPLFMGDPTLPGRPLVVNHDIGGRFAIRNGKWKLVLGKPSNLFDLDADPKESRNLAAKYPEVVQELQETLDRYKRTGRSR